MSEENSSARISSEELKKHIIVALDMDSLGKASPIIEALAPYVGCFKIGLELLGSVGAPSVVHQIHRLGGQVFLDGKFCDIPNTVAGASRAAASLGVQMFNVHASCGLEAIRAANENKGSAELLVVTVLTSLTEENTQAIFGNSVEYKVKQFANMALTAGADGLVCSPLELEILANHPEFKDLKKVTPGIRPSWSEANDQKRTLTPKEAFQKGATDLVIGRPILSPPRGIGTPIDAITAILKEMGEA